MAEAFVARDEELQHLGRVLEADGPRAVVVSGSAGVGKSRLLAEVAHTATERGWSVEWVFASRSVRSIPLGAISHLLTESPAEDPSRVFHSAIGSLRRKARGTNILLVVDDCHELDDGSAAFARQLLMHDDARAILAMRPESSPPDVVTALWKDGIAPRMELDPLDRPGVERLAELALGAAVHSELLDEVWRITLGNPLYLLTGLQAAREHGSLLLRDGTWQLSGQLVSEQLNELVLSRVRGLDDRTRDALALVAVGGSLRAGYLERLVPREAVGLLTEGGLVSVSVTDGDPTVSIAHPLYGEVVMNTLTPERRRSIKAALADATLSDPLAEPVDRLRAAVWVLEADRGPLDHDLGVEAAREAMRRVDFALAERLALATVTNRPASTIARIALGRAFAFQGRVGDAEAVLVEATPESDAEIADVALALGHALAFVGRRPDSAAAVLVEAANKLDPGPLRARLDAERSLYGAIAGDFQAVFEATEAVLGNRNTPDLTLLTAHVNLGLARAMTARLDGFDDDTDTALRLAREHAGEVPLAADQLGLNRVAAWNAAGRLVEAEQYARDRVQDSDAADTPNPLWLAWFGYALGQRGQLAEAIEVQQRAVDLLEEVDPFRLHAQSVGLLALHRAQSRALPDDITDALDAAEQEAGGETRLAVFVGRARAWVNACAGELGTAAELAAEVGGAAIKHDHIAWGATALHDAVRLGHPELVRTALAETVRATSGARLLEAMRDHAAALDDSDPTQLDAAAGALARVGSPLLAAEAWAQLAQLHLDRQEPEDVCRAALRAELAHQQCSLAATPALDGIPESISARERSVVEELLGGLTSRQIAERLYVSVRTVDNHLHSVYRKLGLSGRDELADLATGAMPASPLPR